ncbi:MAG: hypothetical protein M1343_11560 [Chloroflexi bacterium]|nr:hypothetical protein [Chloroflexota bacterium]MDA8186913.1 hypothetical protein [Dehalococcoidales bacterium]
MRYYAQIDGQMLEMDIEGEGDDLKVVLDGETLVASLRLVSPPSLYSLILDNQSHEVFVENRNGEYVVMIAGELCHAKVQDERAKRLAAVTPKGHANEGEVVIRAPMPGLVISLDVSPGDVVEKGKGLLVLEAMKMQNELRAPQAGTIKSVNVQQGERVENGRVLLVLT